ncbi:LolA family protein [Parabacteroides gordonii]|nr:outer membrane lipoprotein carrier protein LolA [Parabacteroides gordonii]MCA5582635.1 outer membrane lipoprotein carrier protein LolA [Parabacteroides gordonii]
MEKKMNKYIYTFLLVVFCLPLAAQKDLTPLASVTAFQERLKKEAASLSSIESDFTQEKFLDVFNEKIVSKGRFYYKQENMIRMDYTSPIDYQIIINGQKLKIVSEGKSNVVNLGSNQMMNEMKGMLAACMIGDLTVMSSAYRLEYYESPSLYVVKIRPVSKSVQAYISEIIISIDKKDMSVQTLRLSENAKDYTEYHFTNRKYNTLTSDEKFVIR